MARSVDVLNLLKSTRTLMRTGWWLVWKDKVTDNKKTLDTYDIVVKNTDIVQYIEPMPVIRTKFIYSDKELRWMTMVERLQVYLILPSRKYLPIGEEKGFTMINTRLKIEDLLDTEIMKKSSENGSIWRP